MKKGKSYITYNDASNHILISALKAKGINKIELIYAPHFASQCGWDMINSDKNCIGWDGWLGYTIREALVTINKIVIKDKHFAYLES